MHCLLGNSHLHAAQHALSRKKTSTYRVFHLQELLEHRLHVRMRQCIERQEAVHLRHRNSVTMRTERRSSGDRGLEYQYAEKWARQGGGWCIGTGSEA